MLSELSPHEHELHSKYGVLGPTTEHVAPISAKSLILSYCFSAAFSVRMMLSMALKPSPHGKFLLEFLWQGMQCCDVKKKQDLTTLSKYNVL